MIHVNRVCPQPGFFAVVVSLQKNSNKIYSPEGNPRGRISAGSNPPGGTLSGELSGV